MLWISKERLGDFVAGLGYLVVSWWPGGKRQGRGGLGIDIYRLDYYREYVEMLRNFYED